MKTLRFLFALFAPLLATFSFAETDLSDFMTPQDMMRNESVSGINLLNNRNAAANVYGLYVRRFSYVTPGNSCGSSTIMYSQNITAGSFVMPTSINAGKSAAIGSNYLYNMLFEALYYIQIIIPSSPPGCALPGCTWGSDTTIYHWCIHLGALAPVTTSTGYTSNIPPSTEAASSAGLYDYNVVSNYTYLGPISCNDQTHTCTVANQQTQSFS